MKYWENLRRERARGIVTLNMMAEYLEASDYEIVHEPTANPSISIIATDKTIDSISSKIEAGSSIFYLATYGGPSGKKEFVFDDRASSYLVVLADESTLPCDPSAEEQRILARSIVVRLKEGSGGLYALESDVANFIISVERFSNYLAQGVNSANQYQALVDVAEEFFGNFISIVDPNYMLLAHTKHIEPVDPISKSLIRHRYHTEEILQMERSQGYLSERISGQDGVRVFPPSEQIPATLMGSPIMVNGNYAGYVVMTIADKTVRPGTKDAFELFVNACEKVASQRNDMPAGRNPYSQNLLITLLSRKAVDAIFVEQQTRRLAIPCLGSFKLIRIIWPEDCTAQLPFFVDEINRSDPRSRVAVRYENAAMVLVYADDVANLNMIASRITSSFPANIAYKIVTSEVLSTLFDIYDAYRSIKCVERYEDAIMRYKEPPADDKPIMLTFRDAFAFYWNDPLRDTSISNYAVSHMVVSDIARIDTEKRTDDLALLETFLVNERKASTVAESHHLHRNGVLYRIKRIQERYNIDLNDHLTRQYILTCLRIRANVHGVTLP